MTVKTDIEIAREASMKPITEVAHKVGIPADALLQYGPTKAKVTADFIDSLKGRPDGKLILVTAINPTPAGEGKTTTTVGLGDGLNRIGKKAIMALREPSLGPCFGVKGGAAGGGYAQVVPMEDINLHFTGDFHAITSAHNLLSALIDNHIYWGNSLGIDSRRVEWRRVLDMNDRALRSIVNSLGGVSNGFPREGRFRHHGRIRSHGNSLPCERPQRSREAARQHHRRLHARQEADPGTRREGGRRHDRSAQGRVDAEPRADAREQPGIHSRRPVRQHRARLQLRARDQTALKLADYVVTEAGFGADLGAEKFFDIKCRKAGLAPSAAVIVATVRALKMHGGVKKEDLKGENVAAVAKGCEKSEAPHRERRKVRRAGRPSWPSTASSRTRKPKSRKS